MSTGSLPMRNNSLALRRSGAQHLREAAWRCWLLIAAVSLLTGITWRVSGGVPAYTRVLDGAGLALWCTAWWLAPAWERMLNRQRIIKEWFKNLVEEVLIRAPLLLV